MLLNLMEDPAINPNINVYYLGWDRTNNTASSGVCIHHPKGAQKKISIENNAIYNYSSSICWGTNCSQGTSPANTHWRVYFDDGTTEGGSSGSPLLNQNHRVIGQLHGGADGCPPNVAKYYGRLDISWNGGGTSTTRLKDWLDPNNTNATTLNGIGYQCNTIYINNQTYSSGTQTITGCKIEISNTTINSGATVNINSQQGVTLKPGFWAKNGSNVRITATQPSSSSLSLSSTQVEESEEDADWLTSLEQAVASPKTGDIDFTVYPNPNDGNFTVEITGNTQAYIVEIFNVSGGIMGKVDCNAGTVNINRSDLPSGIYYLKISTGNESAVKKLIVK
jgi:hypothetical protein